MQENANTPTNNIGDFMKNLRKNIVMGFVVTSLMMTMGGGSASAWENCAGLNAFTPAKGQSCRSLYKELFCTVYQNGKPTSKTMCYVKGSSGGGGNNDTVTQDLCLSVYGITASDGKRILKGNLRYCPNSHPTECSVVVSKKSNAQLISRTVYCGHH